MQNDEVAFREVKQRDVKTEATYGSEFEGGVELIGSKVQPARAPEKG